MRRGAVLKKTYALAAPPLGTLSTPSPTAPSLRWLRMPRGGKAVTLNHALGVIETGLVITVDADTLLEDGALAAMRGAFDAEPDLVAATGVLHPTCGDSISGRIFQWFQTYEYVRNFLSRYAWMETNSLLLISGAFAGFRRDALVRIGGFDPDSLVEDYEVMHPPPPRLARQRARMDGARRRWCTGFDRFAGQPDAVPPPAPTLVRRVPANPILEPRYDRQWPVRGTRHGDASCESARYRSAALRPRCLWVCSSISSPAETLRLPSPSSSQWRQRS